MLEVRYRDIEEILKLLRDAQILDHPFGLFTESSIQGKGVSGVNVRHLEIVF